MLSALIALSGLAAALQTDAPPDDPFWIKLDMSERPADGDRPPTVTYAGTTNLPDGTRLDIEIYYEKYFIGRSLLTKALPVLDGKFLLEMVLYPHSKKNLAGPHFVRTWVYLDQQNARVRAALGEGPRNRKYDNLYHIGTPEEAKAEQRKLYLLMVDYVNRFEAILEEIKAHGKEVKGRFDRAAWKRKQAGWEERALAIEREAKQVNKFVALKLDHLVKRNFEDLRTGVSIVANWTATALENPDNPVVAQMLQHQRITQAKSREEVLKAADPDWGNATDLVKHLEHLRGILHAALEKPKEPHDKALKDFVATLFKVQPYASEQKHHVIISIVTELRTFFRVLPEELPRARQLQASIDANIVTLIKGLKQ